MTDDDQVWSDFSRDPRDPAQAGLRAADADREVAHRVLGEAYADGRIDRAELEARTAEAESARTLGDLLPPLHGLVSAAPAPRPPAGAAELRRRAVDAWRADRREALWGLLSVSAVVWTLWLVTSGVDSFPWPVFVTLAAALNLGRLQFQKQDRIEEERRRLEKKQRKQLEQRRQGDPPDEVP